MFFSVSYGLAERVGFEPTVEFPLHTLSKRAPSTTRTSLRFRINDLRAARQRLSHTPSTSRAVRSISFALSGLTRYANGRSGELCQTSECPRSTYGHSGTKASLRSESSAQ